MKKIIPFLIFLLAGGHAFSQFINVSGINTTGRFSSCAQPSPPNPPNTPYPLPTITAELINLNGGAVVNAGVFTCNNGCDSSTVRVTMSNVRWNQVPNAEWLHGLFLPANAGFNVYAVAIPAGFITYNPGCVGMCPSGSGFNGGPGFYFDNTAANTCCGAIAANDGLPCNNYGDVAITCNNLFTLIFDIKFCNSIITNNSYTFLLSGSSDGETGCWNFNDLLAHTIQFTIATNPCTPTAINPTAAAPVRTCVGNNLNYTSTLTGSCNNNVSWWDDPVAGNLVGTGSPFIYDPAGAACPAGVTLYATCCTGNIAGCISRVPVTIPGTCDVLTITNVNVTDATCLAQGSINSTTVINAIGVINYNLNPGNFNNATGIFTGLNQTQYTLTATDATGCTATSIVNIAQPPPIIFSNPVISGTTCALPNSGQIVISATGGTGPVVLSINPFAAQGPPGTFTGLSAQTYTITATDSLNCTVTTIISITNSPPVNWVTVSSTDALCNGSNDGTISVVAGGGLSPYSYTLMPGGANNNTGNFTGLAPNSYTVTAVDLNGCTASTVLVINNPTVVAWTLFSSVNVLCANGSTGSISVLVGGGTPGYVYNLMPGNINSFTGNFNALPTGTYTVTATDVNGCSITSTVNITQPPVINYITTTATAAICNGANNGSINVVATGGNGVLTYTLNPGNISNVTGIFPNLAAGTYTITTTDANNCTLTTIINVNQPVPVTFPSVVTGSPTCAGLSNGSLSVVAAGGVGVITYTLNPPGIVNITGNFSGLAAGTYTVLATDANGCTATTIVVLSPPAAITFPSVTTTPALCNGVLNGAITIVAAGGAGGFTYLLQPGGILSNNGQYTGLGAGVYTITAIDANNCSNTTTATITQPATMIWNVVTANNVTCNGANDGNISGTAGGGVGAITYTLDPLGISNLTGTFTNLAGGVYTLTATDANGCSINTVITIVDPGVLTISNVSIVPPNCVPGNNGVVDIQVSGGTAPFNYNIGAGNQPGNIFNNVGQGNYTVTVTDANNCTATSIINVVTPNSPVFTNIVVQNVNCFGGGNGSIVAQATGGNGQITYVMQPGNITNFNGVFSNLAAGSYTITATDINNCNTQTIVIVTSPVMIIIDSVVHQDILCNNGILGSINAYASGGVGILSYTLQPGNITNLTGDFPNLPVGNYVITITDANGCFVQTNVNIILLPIMQWDSVSYATLFCAGGNNGYIYATVTGGVAPITYTLSPGNVVNLTGYYPNLVAGLYVVTATDVNGCTTTISINLSQPSAVVISSVVNTLISCIPGNDGTITVTATGGTPSYTYTKSGGGPQPGNVFTGVGAGIYLITVTDVNGCTATVWDTLYLPVPPVLNLISSTQVTCNGDTDGAITVSGTGGVGALTYNLMPGNVTNLTGVYNNLAGGTYTITVTDILNCTSMVVVNVVNPAPVTITNVIIAQPLCTGDNNGTITVSAAGGTGIFTSVLNPGAITNQTGLFSNLGVGTYTIIVSDANNCSTSTIVIMTQPTAVSWDSVTFISPTCNGLIDGSISVNALGGVGAFSYLLLPNGTLNNTGYFNNINAGSYTINATDANGCSISTILNVTQPPALTIINLATTPPTCLPGYDGSVTITVGGGTAPYNYNIGAGNQPSNIFTGLGGGIYTITVTDANNCTLTNVVSLTNPGAPVVSNVTPVNATCNGSNDGSITIVTTGGNPPITYTLLPGGALNNTGIFTGLGPNTYTINVSDANGCTTVATAIISAPNSMIFSSLVSTDVSCFGGNDGTITGIVSGGTGTITYVLMPGNISNITGVFASLIAGVYTITATDINGCSTIGTVTVIEPAQLIWGNIIIGNVSCNNGNDGNIAATTSGGTGNVTYTLLPNNISNLTGTFSNLAFGTYTVQAADANGCSISTVVVINQTTPVVISNIVTTIPTCIPGNDATITITASGGLLPYNYNIGFGNQLSNVFTNAGAGNYTVTVTDANGCSATSAFAVSNPSAPTITNVNVNDVSCYGGNDGDVIVVATGGIGTLTYTLLPNNMNNLTGIFGNLIAGVYTVNVTDASNCSVSSLITITEPNALAVASIATNNILCFGGNNGDVTITTLGGTGIVDFALIPGNITNQTGFFNNLAAGTYTINCVDANGCTVSTTFSILVPPAMVMGSPIITNVLCYNGNDGNVSVTATGGTGNISYTLQPLGITNNTGFFNSLATGNYTIIATDANGCTVSTVITITQPAPTQLVNFTVVTPSCVPGNDGIITVNVIGGIPPYQYSINGGAPQLSNTFNNLAAGTYTILVADVNDCKVILVVTLANSQAPVFTSVITNPVNCFGAANGNIDVIATGGFGAINYTILPNNITNLTGLFPNLTAGTYTINAVDANGCSVSTIVVVGGPLAVLINTLTNTNVTCNGGSNATITAVAAGGVGALNYNLQPGNQNNITGLYTGLTAGIYTLTVSDANGCTVSSTVTITEPTLLVWASATQTPVSCSGGNDGTITVLATGGTGIIDYNLQPGNITNQTGFFNNLAAGNYTIIATDALGCSLPGSVTVTSPLPVVIVSVSNTTPSCVPGNDGSITITAGGGIPPYNYNIGGANQAGNVFPNVGTGTYTLTVTDANGCTVTSVYNVTAPNAPSFTNVITTPVLCNGGTDGTITVTATGGAGGINYTLLPNNITNASGIFNNLAAGLYTIQAIDASNCSVSTTVQVSEPAALVWGAIATTNVICNGGADATITAVVTGGIGAYNYNLQAGNLNNATGIYTNLIAGIYTLTTTDANGCTITTSITLTEPTPVVWSSTAQTNVSCNGGNDATITVLATGGAGLMSYNLQPNNITNGTGIFTTLIAGIYTVIATDANGCSISTTLTITEPTPLVITTVTNTTPSCIPGNDGSINITTSGGTPVYSYNIGGANQPGNVFANVGTGNYTITVTDANGCTVTSIYNVTAPNAPIITNIVLTAASCAPGADATATVTATGGNGAYTYSSDGINFQVSNVLTGLSNIIYTITVVDAFGCSVTSTVQVNNAPSPVITNITTTLSSCIPGCDATATITASGGLPGYTYSLDGITFQASPLFSNLCTAGYTATVKDANGCTSTSLFNISTSTGPVITNTAFVDILCNGGNNGSITVQTTGGTGTINYTLQPNNITNITGIFTNLIAGIYTVLIVDANGCGLNTVVTISEPPALQFVNIVANGALCSGAQNGTIDVTTTGGTGLITYTINPIANFVPPATFNNLLGNTTYTIIATDANGCSISTAVFIFQPPALTIDSSFFTDITCSNAGDGSITVYASGGTGILNYNLMPGNLNNLTGAFTGLAANVYTVTITDANNCTLTSTFTIAEPLPITLVSINATNVSCNNAQNATITILCAGGTGILNYNLQPTNTNNNTGLFTNLGGGTYTITVTDVNNCSYSTTIAVVNPPILSFGIFTVTNISCFGNNDGSVAATAIGGTGTLTYVLQPGNVVNLTGLFNGLAPGIYTVSVTDANLCSTSSVATISEPLPLTIVLDSVQNVICHGGTSGAIVVTASGGTIPYTFTLNPTGVTNNNGNFQNVAAGTYTVIVTDANGCTNEVQNILIIEPPAIVFTTVSHVDVICYGDSTGSITVQATGGTGGIIYSLSPALGIQFPLGFFANLPARVYTVTATDALNCTLTTIVDVQQNNEIIITEITWKEPVCYGEANGIIHFKATGGVAPLTYHLDNNVGQPTGYFPNVSGGLHLLTITDVMGCRKDSLFLLPQPEPVHAGTLTIKPESCKGAKDAQIIVVGAGGRGGYTYYIRPGLHVNQSGLFYGFEEGVYTLTIKDSSQCTWDSIITVSPPVNALSIYMTKKDLGCFGTGVEGWAQANVSGGLAPYTYMWSTLPSQLTDKATGLFFGHYFVEVVDANGCKVLDSVYIEPGPCCDEVFIPNAFSPNGDGNNDLFRVTTATGVELLQFDIYDRWGVRVWGTTDFRSGWDGTYMNTGKEANVNTYYYIMRYICMTDGKIYIKKGDINLIR